jgi:diguanylate cyclase (GGDEF)-like protein
MYDPLVVDTFVRVYGELHSTSPERTSETFAAITGASAPRPQSLKTQPLDDIASSSEEMLTLFTLAKDVTGRMSVADIGDVLLRHLRRMVPASLSIFYIHSEDTTELVATHVSGENSDTLHGLRIPLGERLTGWVGANRQSIRNSDPVLDFGEAARTMTPRLRSCLSTPLISGDTLVGVLSLYSKSHEAFTEDHQRLLEIVARQVSPVLLRSIQYATSTFYLLRDPLTGLPNVEHLRRFSEDQGSSSTDLPSPSALIHVDVSDLKRIYASHGRSAGDQILHDIVGSLRQNLRATDVLFRLESDEFAVLLLHTSMEIAGAIAERMRTSIQDTGNPSEGKLHINVTITVAATPEDGVRIKTLVDAARRRLGSRGRRSISSASESIH